MFTYQRNNQHDELWNQIAKVLIEKKSHWSDEAWIQQAYFTFGHVSNLLIKLDRAQFIKANGFNQ